MKNAVDDSLSDTVPMEFNQADYWDEHMFYSNMISSVNTGINSNFTCEKITLDGDTVICKNFKASTVNTVKNGRQRKSASNDPTDTATALRSEDGKAKINFEMGLHSGDYVHVIANQISYEAKSKKYIYEVCVMIDKNKVCSRRRI